MELSRRNFLVAGTAAAYVAGLSRADTPPRGAYGGKFCLFSKHLREVDARAMAQRLKRAGFGGVDLCVRKDGHVLPEKVAADLPRALAAIREEGLEAPMITTALLSAAEPTAGPILAAAGKLSIPFFKPGYYKYDFVDVRRELEKAGNDFRGLAELGRQHGMQAGYHNHAGNNVGAPVWDIMKIIEGLDPKWVGYYFDVCHAVAEGAVAGWKIALNLVAPRLKMVAIKDSYFEKTSKGWRRRYCPLGEGMVDWKSYSQALAQAGFQGPMSLHMEYETGGSTPGEKADNMVLAAQSDLEFLKARVQEAYGS